MKKLYCIDLEYVIKGNGFSFFTKNKEKNVLTERSDLFLISSKDTIKADLKKYLESKITDYKDMIEEENKIILLDYNTFFYEKLNKINGYELKSFSYREATLNECLDHLTPDQFKELYGNIILKGE